MDETRVSTALFLAFRSLNRYYQHFAKQFGLPASQLAALQKLWQEDGLTISELGERMGLNASTVTGLVDRLERSGLVYRSRSKNDRRVVTVWLTEKAAALRKHVPSFSKEVERLIGDRLEQGERRKLASYLLFIHRLLESCLTEGTLQKEERSHDLSRVSGTLTRSRGTGGNPGRG